MSFILGLLIFFASPFSFAADLCSASLGGASQEPEKLFLAQKRAESSYRDEHLLTTQLVDKLFYLKNSTALLFGNSSTSTVAPLLGKMTLEDILTTLAQEKAYFFYDADTVYGAVIQKFLKDKAIGISARTDIPLWDPTTRIAAIPNPYLRLKIFKKCRHLLGTADSLLVPALQLEGEEVSVLPLANHQYRDGIDSWSQNFARYSLYGRPEKLGYFYVRSNSTIQNVSEVTKRYLDVEKYKPFEVSADLEGEDFSRDYAVSYAKLMSKTIESMESEGADIPRGAVVFASGGKNPQYEKLVYDVSFALGRKGITGVTGGSGGYMKVANLGFFMAGSHSVGIPLGTGWKTKGELDVSHECQTVTWEAGDYESRIPLLLHERPLIVVAPGGGGTMKELATTLVALNAAMAEPKELVFLSSNYYGGLVDHLKQVAQLTPESQLSQRITVVNDVDALAPILARLETVVPQHLKHILLRTEQEPRKRNVKILLDKSKPLKSDSPKVKPGKNQPKEKIVELPAIEDVPPPSAEKKTPDPIFQRDFLKQIEKELIELGKTPKSFVIWIGFLWDNVGRATELSVRDDFLISYTTQAYQAVRKNCLKESDFMYILKNIVIQRTDWSEPFIEFASQSLDDWSKLEFKLTSKNDWVLNLMNYLVLKLQVKDKK